MRTLPRQRAALGESRFKLRLTVVGLAPPMRTPGRIKRSDYPKDELLTRLAAELDAAQPDRAAPRVLQRLELPSYPDALGPCAEFSLTRSEFVFSQKRTDGKLYITICGKREYEGKGAKKVRSKQPWPLTQDKSRLRPISLHRWICVFMHGLPPSKQHEATHVCGNDACVAGGHIRWQFYKDNLDDVPFHNSTLSTTPEGTRRFSRIPWCQ